MSKKISQRAARRALRELAAIKQRDEDRRRVWSDGYPGGIEIVRVASDEAVALVKLARKLGHAVVCTFEERHEQADSLILHAVRY